MSIKYLIGKRAAVIEYEGCCQAEDEGNADLDCDDCKYDDDCVYRGDCSNCEEHGTCDSGTEAKKETRRWQGIILDVAYSNSYAKEKEDKGLFLNVTMLRDNGEVYTWYIDNDQELRLEGDEYNIVKNKLLNCIEEKEEAIARAELMDFEE